MLAIKKTVVAVRAAQSSDAVSESDVGELVSSMSKVKAMVNKLPPGQDLEDLFLLFKNVSPFCLDIIAFEILRSA